MAEHRYRIATIANGASLSDAVELPAGFYMAAVEMPAAWTAAALTFQAGENGDDFSNVYDADGDEVEVAAAEARWVVLTPADWCAVPYVKVRSGTAASAVNQAAEREIKLILRPI